MIRSMTGFGRYELTDDEKKLTVEIKSVNHRYLDLNVKLPRRFNRFEQQIRNIMKEYVQRGKVDVFISYEDTGESKYALHYNEELAKQYLDFNRKMAEQFGIENDMTTSKLSRYPEVFVMEEQDEDEEKEYRQIEKAVTEAAKQFLQMRTKEGENLLSDLSDKLSNLKTYIDEIEKRSPDVVIEYQKKLSDKVSDLLLTAGIDQNRLLAEVTIYADKVCVDEEIVRFRSHLDATLHTLQEKDSIGRKLDFIVQEMNREANTILSKSNDVSISDSGINLKTEVEKLREQIQNIE